MIEELDLVVLTHEITEYELKRGDVGTVVHCYRGGDGFEVEFVTADGETIGALTLTHADIRPRAREEFLRVREFEP